MRINSYFQSSLNRTHLRSATIAPVNPVARIPQELPRALFYSGKSDYGNRVNILLDLTSPAQNLAERQNMNTFTKTGMTAAGISKDQASSLQKAKQDLQIQKAVSELKSIDTQVRSHEMAHMSAGSGLITRSASFTYQEGPDGKRYAVGGEVGIDTSTVPDDPEATIARMQQVRAAALAPARPSGQDLSVAASASAQEAQALAEIAKSRLQEQKSTAQPSTESINPRSLYVQSPENSESHQTPTDSQTQEYLSTFLLFSNAQANLISKYIA